MGSSSALWINCLQAHGYTDTLRFGDLNEVLFKYTFKLHNGTESTLKRAVYEINGARCIKKRLGCLMSCQNI